MKPTDLVFLFLVLTGIILYWVSIDPNGFLIYSSLIIMTLYTVVPQLLNKKSEVKYPKWMLISIVFLIAATGIDRMTIKVLSPLVFPICYIFYILIQPKPAWITRP